MTNNEADATGKNGAKLSVQAGRVSRARHRVSEHFEMFPSFPHCRIAEKQGLGFGTRCRECEETLKCEDILQGDLRLVKIR